MYLIDIFVSLNVAVFVLLLVSIVREIPQSQMSYKMDFISISIIYFPQSVQRKNEKKKRSIYV